MDIDLKSVPIANVWQTMKTFPLPPSFIVHSGGGLHVYWLLESALLYSSDTDRDRAEYWCAELAHRFDADPSVAESARVLRLPDTFNLKNTNPRAVTIVNAHPDRRYRFDEIVAVLGDVPTGPAKQIEPTDPIDHGLSTEKRVEMAKRWAAHRQPAVQGQNGDTHTYSVCAGVAHGHDLKEDDAFEALKEWNQRCLPPWPERELRVKIRRAVRYAKGARGAKLFRVDPKGKLIPHQDNIRLALDALGVVVRYNEFAHRYEIEWNGRHLRLEDAALDDLFLAVEARFKFRPEPQYFDKVVEHIGRQLTYHPVRDYLDSLEWDGVKRIDTWLHVRSSASASSLGSNGWTSSASTAVSRRKCQAQQ